MVSVKINGLKYELKKDISIIEGCKIVGITIPRFCYHETLSVSGNCRMCLVEIEGMEKPAASCLTEMSEGISIYTDSLFVKKARENVLETLLVNHPLDCPICDQAGECDLQDQAKTFSSDYSRYFFKKRGVEDKNCGPLIKTIMTRCIHCTRCVRFGSEVAGIEFLGTLNRGTSTEIGSYLSKFFDSEISGNVIDLCPVGALTAKPYGFKGRPWELRVNETIDLTDSTGSNIYVNFKEANIYRVLPKNNANINENIITDKARFSYDANRKNRIKNVFMYRSSVQKLRTINWTKYFKEMDNMLNNKDLDLHVVANEDIGFENLEYLKNVSRSSKNIHLSSFNSTINHANSYIYRLTDKISSINECKSVGFVFSVNPKLECGVVNTRLRTQYRNTLLDLVTFGLSYSYNIPTKFVNLSLLRGLTLFEGEYNDFSKKCIKSESPLVIISDLFNKRGLNNNVFIEFIKKSFNTAKILKINKSSNSEALDFLNIKNQVKSNNKKDNSIFCLSLDDNYSTRKSLLPFKNTLVWFNSFGSDLAFKLKMLVPTLSEFEDERIVLNLEHRAQKTSKTFDSFGDARNLKQLLISLFNNIEVKSENNIKFYNFVQNIVENGNLFEKTSKKNIQLFNNKENIIFNACLSKYPIKSSIEDFYCSTNYTKNSPTMLNSTNYLRSVTNNFINKK